MTCNIRTRDIQSGQDLVENGDTAGIEAYLQEACGAQTEGLMVKTLDDNATYVCVLWHTCYVMFLCSAHTCVLTHVADSQTYLPCFQHSLSPSLTNST